LSSRACRPPFVGDRSGRLDDLAVGDAEDLDPAENHLASMDGSPIAATR
jgi:hypothetical protein